jgi:RNA polymerase sigma factor (sigma-70 family)
VDADLNDPSQRRWERGCLERARAGDTAAFGEIYDAYAARLYERVLWPALGNAAAAEDALADTFRSAFQRLHEFQAGEVSIYHYLARIAKNKALDLHRARKVTGRALANFESLLEPLCTPPASPEDLLLGELTRQRLGQEVEATLSEINPRYRAAISLRFLQDQPREQCAEQLEVKLGTVDVVLLRALKAFRKRWEERTTTDLSPPHLSRPSALP